ncbi:hypothetical protein AOL_s00188g109 [Orbilia oligospora ATCC 24927]|uniref:Uncharacterized protein n=2 Tax=Orbilia oligospora TaxID=2813651 RepID=G1XQ98_ARTOA|nr:hypothetical protein AOL_s00188g109 [Orbilia oligospora ATCC 24927]EGX44771.1 hypothetical protein AOL_s00188g109 [Orbilia oligospora ATCC 24927]
MVFQSSGPKVFNRMADIKEREPEVASKPSKSESPEIGLKCLLPRILCAAVAVIGVILLVRDWWRMKGVTGRNNALEVEYKFYTSMYPGVERRDMVRIFVGFHKMLEIKDI